jgi:hypothetical protein
MKKNILLLSLLVLIIHSQAQNVVVSDDSTYVPQSTNSLLEIYSSQGNKGVLVPKLTSSQRTAMSLNATHDKGLLVYDSDTKSYWYYDGTSWVEISKGTALQDADGDTKIQVEESADEDKIRFDVGGSEAVVIDDDGNMGVGTNNPSSLLHLKAQNTTWDRHIRLENYSNTDYATILFDDDGVKFKTMQDGYDYNFRDNDNTTNLIIKDGGNVGIGTAVPSNKLTVDGYADFTMRVGIGTNILNHQFTVDGNSYFTGNVGLGKQYPASLLHLKAQNTTWDRHIRLENYSNTDYATILFDDDGVKFRTMQNGYNYYFRDDGNNTILFIKDGGKVGIGTESPANLLTVNGYANFTGNVGIGTSFPSHKLVVNGNIVQYSGYFMATDRVKAIDGDGLRLFEDGNHGIFVKDGGNVGIGTESPTQKLEVDGNILQTDGDYMATDQVRAIDGDGLKLTDDAGIGIFVKDGGNVGIGTTAPTQKLVVDGNILQTDSDYTATEHVRAIDGDGLRLYDDGGNGIFVEDGGFVGIGTTNPGFPLEVGISGGSYSGSYGYLNSSGNTGTYTGSGAYSIKAAGRIMASEFNAVSDQRIKTQIQSTNTQSDLDKLMQLRLTTYHFIDSVATGTKLQKGFIAQEVEEVIPEAVNQSTGFIPDIFALAGKITTQDKQILVEMSKAHGLKSGDKVRLISPDGQFEVEVLETPTENSFIVMLEQTPESLFVYGKQVEDFRAVDYDYIFSTGIGAIQELARQNSLLRQQNADLQLRASNIENRLEVLEQALSNQSTLLNK